MNLVSRESLDALRLYVEQEYQSLQRKLEQEFEASRRKAEQDYRLDISAVEHLLQRFVEPPNSNAHRDSFPQDGLSNGGSVTEISSGVVPTEQKDELVDSLRSAFVANSRPEAKGRPFFARVAAR